MSDALKTLTPELQSLISAVENVLVVSDGNIIHQQLSPAFDGLTINQTLIYDADRFDLDDPAVAYNLEHTNSTLSLKVPKDTQLKPTLYLFVLQGTLDLVHQTHLHLEANASLNLFEYLGNTTQAGINILTHADVEPYAKLNYLSLAAHTKHAAVSLNRFATIAERANATYTLALFGEALTQQNTHHILQGYQGESLVKVVAFTDQTQEAFIRTLVEHQAIDSVGNIEHYGVANDESFLTFEGMGKIHKGMRQSKAFQSTKGVVLAPKARLDANPLLVIDEYDVEAGHGAAVGRIDEEQLYYMMSRGLTKKEAERLIINGFLAPLSQLLADAAMDDHIRALLAAKTQ